MTEVNGYKIEPSADLSRADLSRANLTGANLIKTTFCGAILDGMRLAPGDIGGPGYIICALTEVEWQSIKQGRET